MPGLFLGILKTLLGANGAGRVIFSSFFFSDKGKREKSHYHARFLVGQGPRKRGRGEELSRSTLSNGVTVQHCKSGDSQGCKGCS